MLNYSEELKSLFRADNLTAATAKTMEIRFYEGNQLWLTIGRDRIISEAFQLKESLSSSDNMDFGSCEAAQVELTCANVEEDIDGKEFWIALIIGDHDLEFGPYIVSSAKRQANRVQRKIIAYDRMTLFDVNVIDWYNGLTFPMSLRDFRASLCAYIGVTEQIPDYLPNEDMVVEKTIDTAELIGRNVLIACEQANGVFGHFDRNGILQHVILQPNDRLVPALDLYPSDSLFPALPGDMNTQVYDEKLDPYLLISCKFEEYTVHSIDKVQIRQEEGDIGGIYGDGSNCYTVEGNFLMYGKSAEQLGEIARNIYGMISGRLYIPYECEAKGLPYMEVGDAVRFEFGNSYIVSYIMNRTLKGIVAMRDTYSATGDEIRSAESNVNTEIIQLKGKSAILKRNVDEVSATVTDLGKWTQAQFKITAEQITAEVTRATGAESELSSKISIEAGRITSEITDRKNADTALSSQITQTASEIRSEVTDAKNGLQSQITQQAGQIALKVSKGSVSSELSLETDQVKITGNRLVVDSTNFKLDASGNATFSGKVEGASITGSVFESDSFYADDSEVIIGDYQVSADSSYRFASQDGSFSVETAGSPSGSVACVTIGNTSGSNKTEIYGGNITATGVIYASVFYDTEKRISQFYDIEPGKSWWSGWTLTETLIDVYDQLDGLSDESLKENIIDIDIDEALEFVLNSRPVTFQFKDDGKWSAGFIAQEVETEEDDLEIYYPLVATDKRTEKYRLNYKNYIPLLVAAIQNLQAQLEEVRSLS